MTWKCSVGESIEFKGTYQWTSFHGASMLKFAWVHKPYSIPIGKGFTVEPKLMHTYPKTPPGYPVKSPSIPSDLNLIVHGPGLPKNGKEVTLSWGPVTGCLSGASKASCRQFLNLQNLKTTSGGSTFSMDFVSGYSEQQYGKTKGNVAFWRVCCSKPYEWVQMAILPDWRQLMIVPTFWWLISKIETCGDAPDCDVPEKLPMDIIDETIECLVATRVPDDQERMRQEALESLEQINAELSEVSALMGHSNEVSSRGERRELRSVAITHLERADDLKRAVIELLLQMEETLGSQAPFEKVSD